LIYGLVGGYDISTNAIDRKVKNGVRKYLFKKMVRKEINLAFRGMKEPACTKK
jgi:hypothetical protein